MNMTKKCPECGKIHPNGTFFAKVPSKVKVVEVVDDYILVEADGVQVTFVLEGRTAKERASEIKKIRTMTMSDLFAHYDLQLSFARKV